jgi:hypothetical protein
MAIKILLILLLAGIAGLEFYHHFVDDPNSAICFFGKTQGKSDEARALFEQHLRSHQ